MTEFRNSYLIMRHGQSEANALDKVVSDPEIGCEQYGLTRLGREQIAAAVMGYQGVTPTKIYCSDFKRTQETAALAAELFSLTAVEKDIRLRERYFGEWEGDTSHAYDLVWASDLLSATETEQGVESTHQVRQRMLGMILALEKHHRNETILLVSHGDPLQILSTAFRSLPPNVHRSLPHHETAAIKLLAAQGEALPAVLLTDGANA